MVMPGPGTTSVACLGAAIVDVEGNIDSTEIPGKAFLVGSGGGNDVASVVDDVVIVTTLTARRTVERAPYVTSPGHRVSHLVTDLGVFEKRDGRFVLTAAVGGAAGVGAVREVCGWDLVVADDVRDIDPPTAAEVETLRRWDPRGFFLRA
jgi:acyl CoA:acetate/3-ketoacid CoA transferase beta subunit